MSPYTVPYKGRADSSKSNMKFLHFFLFVETILACVDPDRIGNPNPDPLTQLNPDLYLKHWAALIEEGKFS